MKTAIVHDFLVDSGGAERVLQILCEAFPSAPIFTSVYNPETTLQFFKGKDVRTSFLQKITNRKKFYKLLLPLYPAAFEQFDLSGYDCVISSTTSFAKGVVTGPDTCHISYCNTPMRFAWRYADYIERAQMSPLIKIILPLFVNSLRQWDFNAAQRVDYFVAGSFNSLKRIIKFYRRDGVVLHSPIDTSGFHISKDGVEDYYLVVSRLVPYKRIDIAIEAFNELGLNLYIIGDGPDRKRLQGMAKPNVKFLGKIGDDALARYYSRSIALIFPGEEDFGLTPLEANASGRPVIAFGRGGALETTIEGVTGRFFYEDNPDALKKVLKDFDASAFDPFVIRRHAEKFDKEIFKEKFRRFVDAKYKEYTKRNDTQRMNLCR